LPSTVSGEKSLRDLTVNEFKRLIRESIAEDIGEWRETFEILSDKGLMRHIKSAEKSHLARKDIDFIPWEKVKRDL
jgi:hypothetical protein